MTKKIKNNEQAEEIDISGVERVTPHNRALYEAGKTLLIESISTSRDFCKFMITVSTSAIPIYLGLLKLIISKELSITYWQAFFIITPTIIFLVAAGIFAYAYYPQQSSLSLDIMEDIEKERRKIIKHRKNLTIIGAIIFSLGVFGMIICFGFFITELR